ncbi:unnamed protein product [Coffea canephora]|uniref:J domain-containing protein n=1 Tax=Coffea canephora TaxID=49390 RepID=A0A068U045_COFCA|nr:unnamed protein product [Coffea canephora]
MGGQDKPPGPGLEPDIQPLLNASKYFLCHRSFSQSLKYADKAQQSNPNHPGPPQILAISTVLSATPSSTRPEQPEWYLIINLPRFTQDQNLIRTRCASLVNLLNPDTNPYPFAAEARDWVVKAESVLFDPDAKAQYDNGLKMTQKNSGNGGGTFWTLCPYCYFMYEYEKMYVDCVLRCQNSKCRRAFTAVAVAASAAPPPELVEEGKYTCYGFSPLGPNNGSGGDSGEERGKSWWAPFVSMGQYPGPVRANEEKVDVRTNVDSKSEKSNGFIEISDDETAGREKIERGGQGNGVNNGKVVMKRKKMAAIGKKKLMGKGIRVVGNHSLSAEGGEGIGFKAGGNEANANTSPGNEANANTSGGVTEGCNEEELEFCAGDDDIFVAVNPWADLGCEKLRN